MNGTVVIGGKTTADINVTGDTSLDVRVDGQIDVDSKILGDAQLDSVVVGDMELTDMVNGEVGSFYEVSRDNRDYELLFHKPSIESVELVGDKTFEELGMTAISNIELANLLR